MEQAQASSHPSHGQAPSSDVPLGMSIARHFDEFRRLKRPFDVAFAAAVPASSTAINALASVSGFRIGHHCCKICKTLLPVTSFYPSHLKRSVFYCKTCCNAKKQASMRTARERLTKCNAVAPISLAMASDEHGTLNLAPCALPRPGAADKHDDVAEKDKPVAVPADAALKMLNRLRRMCARPSQCGLRLILPNPVSLNFDVKVARQLLLWWESTSALGGPAAAASAIEDDHEMRFVPWLSQLDQLQSLTALQPWEVIPVTQMQARRLTSTPPHLWMQMLDPAAAAHIMTRCTELKRVILGDA